MTTRIRKRFVVFIILLALPVIFTVSCQHKLIYFPRPYPAGFAHEWEKQYPPSQQLHYETSQGQQSAFLLMPQTGTKPEHLWLVCGGNGTLSAEWTEWLAAGAPKNDAYLLLDYPGYGDCQGASTPKRIRENIATALPLAAKKCHMSLEDIKTRGRFLGHSLGCAAALIGACDYSLPEGILIAPFTSSMDMAEKMLGLPVGWIVTHRFDNRARVKQWLAQNGRKIHIFHSDDDPVIPLQMGHELAAMDPSRISITTVPSGGHDALIRLKKQELYQHMKPVE